MPLIKSVTFESPSVKARKFITVNDLRKQVLTKKSVVVSITSEPVDRSGAEIGAILAAIQQSKVETRITNFQSFESENR